MTSCTVKERKKFMGKFLTTDCFDLFLLKEALIVTGNTFTIDGRMEKQFFTDEEWEELSRRQYDFSPWSVLRPVCFDLIRGKKTPVRMKFVLHLKQTETEKILSQAGLQFPPDILKAFVLTVRYDGNNITCTTGISYTSFVLDREAEHLWDTWFSKFLDQNGVLTI